ncbi:permease prefix domain 1-containing protein [Microbacterium sp. Marseille-Q6965]|uniref:permease prefix domain 1-containing protein n=1 Tax=Microbacterium sp. Marseille-Q6965 TaxID=2965072 RepID=UPI0021B76D44|nr:permease prefix domain 1-containing protein [Microbacterium sp. Marseille-Q6965]
MEPITKDDYTNRYVEAATRSLPPDQRDDYADELRASIRDQVDDRIANGEDPAAAERAVLTDLGDPALLAAGYAGRQLQLIGPAYFSDWKRLLVLMLWTVVPVAAFVGGLVEAVQGDVGGVVGGAVAVALTAGMHVFFWVTLAFALVERYGEPQGKRRRLGVWELDMLPMASSRRAQFGEVVLAFVFPAILLAAWLWDRYLGFVPWETTGGEPLSLLHPGLWPWGVAIALAGMLATALLTLIAYLRGAWATWMGAANALICLAFTVAAVVLQLTGRLVNPAFAEYVFRASAPGTVQVIGIVVAAGIAALGVWASWDSFRRTRALR